MKDYIILPHQYDWFIFIKFSKIFYNSKNIINSNLNSDSFFSRSNIETAKEAIQFVLGEKGYAFPLVQLNVDLKDDSESVDITIRVDPKKKSFVQNQY